MVLSRPVHFVEPVKDFASPATPDYDRAEQLFIQLLTTENLDLRVTLEPDLSVEFEAALQTATSVAYTDRVPVVENRFLQRILYRINRLNFIWYKDLNEYTNERSLYVQWVRDRIEKPWQVWESAQIDLSVKKLSADEIKEALIARADVDLEPSISANSGI